MMKVRLGNALRENGVKTTYETLLPLAESSHKSLFTGEGKGSDFLGWVGLPSSITDAFLGDIQATADRLRRDCEFVVTIGIGGSYLGIKAVVEALSDAFAQVKPAEGARLLYAGHHISEDYMAELLELLRGRKFGLINISKSGTTTEPAVAFRLLKQLLEEQEGTDFAREHIVAITDQAKGALRSLADKMGYKSYVIPDNVGGRFSVLTPVGLVPIATAGFDITALVRGAQAMEQALQLGTEGAKMVEEHAATRVALYRSGKKIEILVNFHPKMHYVNEWWKQLFGESEGKEHKGLFPTAVDFSTDLHSMGQWIQEGERTIFETFISVEEQEKECRIPTDGENLDGLNFIAGKRIDFVNKQAERGTMLAHLDGGVPVVQMSIERLDAYNIGQLFYYFEKLVGISGYLLEVNPFDQPGVEAYKKNMFALLDKPGFEEASKAIKARVSELD
ncbi:glucose-6-phosphate isomerase [Porphyromonas levii]|uniref:glucose-6-phosphate isomerase n=1 Tax=Porphyromonas levii TaxID=28114 RepID=UPI003D16164D